MNTNGLLGFSVGFEAPVRPSSNDPSEQNQEKVAGNCILHEGGSPVHRWIVLSPPPTPLSFCSFAL